MGYECNTDGLPQAPANKRILARYEISDQDRWEEGTIRDISEASTSKTRLSSPQSS